MEYLHRKSFSVGLGGKPFSDGWERIFGKKEPEQAEGGSTPPADASATDAPAADAPTTPEATFDGALGELARLAMVGVDHHPELGDDDLVARLVAKVKGADRSGRLAAFLAHRYAHRTQAGESEIDAAIRLLTPFDGSEAAWERMRLVCSVTGDARRRLEDAADEVLQQHHAIAR